MKRGFNHEEPIPWEQLTREAYGRAMHHRFKGEVGYAEAEERFAVWCEYRERAARLRAGEPPIPGVTSDDDSPNG